MSTRASLSTNLPQRLKAACERLIHPSVSESGERVRHERLLQVLLAAPVLAAAASAQVMPSEMGGAAALAAASMTLGIGLLMPFLLIATGRRRLVESAALVLGALAVAAATAASAGMASPLSVMAAALAVEAGWVGRTRRAVGFGIAAGVAALVMGAVADWSVGSMPAATPSGWLWLVPLCYAVLLFLRWPAARFGEGETTEDKPQRPVEEIIGAAILRMQSNGDVTRASPQARLLLGVAPELLLGSGFFERIHVADRVPYLETLADLREQADRKTVRLRMRVPVETGIPAGSSYGTFVADIVAAPDEEEFVVVLTDGSASAELEQALANANDAAQGAALAKEQFLASVSHELRTPLNAIVGFSDLLANEMFGRLANERQREYVDLIREASGHLLSVVNGILDVSKLQSGSYMPEVHSFRFEEAVRLCVAMSAREAEAKSLEIKTEIAEDIGVITCDRRVVQQVLINLLSNAVKFTPSGEVKVAARRDGDRLELTVSDTGIGMSAEDLERIGTPFVQVQNGYTSQGTGLGIALVKGLVGMVGGGMSIESVPGSGTSVHVWLPAGRASQELPKGETETSASRANRNSEWDDGALRKSA